MSDSQWRVLWILGIAFGLELVFNPLSQSIVFNASAGHLGTKGTSKSVSIFDQATPAAVGLAMYGIGVFIAIIFADVLPTVTTWFAVIILTIIILKHGSDLGNAVNTGITGLNSLRGGK